MNLCLPLVRLQEEVSAGKGNESPPPKKKTVRASPRARIRQVTWYVVPLSQTRCDTVTWPGLAGVADTEKQ